MGATMHRTTIAYAPAEVARSPQEPSLRRFEAELYNACSSAGSAVQCATCRRHHTRPVKRREAALCVALL
jgi:hypothetical protein